MQPVTSCDLLVVGGGINGVGIARDASGRGLKVVVAEKDDLASHTSNWSSKLIHGGLRYLEHYEFRLVREALIERETLLKAAPHIIWPLNFVLPHSPEQRPAWLIRLGLFMYDHLGGREILPGSKSVDLAAPGPLGDPLKDWVTKGFTYSDCFVMDSRLVVLNALDAKERGAEIHTRTRCTGARREGDRWVATLKGEDGAESRVEARALVNTAGPWVSEFLRQGLGSNSSSAVRLVKGSHIVVPKLYEGAHPYILQNDDKRIVFAIPYEDDYTLIGTTDVEFEGDPGKVEISPEEAKYLCQVINRYFKREITPDDVAWTYSGVRPLYDDASGNASAVTRDYVFDLDAPDGQPPLLSVFGGKITTFRKLAEHAMEKLSPKLGVEAKGWTAKAHLPGGDIPKADFDGFLAKLKRERSFLPEGLAKRLARMYGTRAGALLGESSGLDDLGRHFGGGLYQREVDYVVANEWVKCGEDLLWRRSKLGLHLDEAERAAVKEYVASKAGSPSRRSAAEAVA